MGMKEWQGIPLVFDGSENKNENKNTFPKMHNGMPVAAPRFGPDIYERRITMTRISVVTSWL